jgi:hypothetical protein
METTKTFDKRTFVALTEALCGLGLAISGLASHIYEMDPMTLPRHAWVAAHSSLGVIFCVFTIWHLILNRKVFTKYLRGLSVFSPSARREAFYAVALVAVLLLIFVGHTFHAE